MFSRSPPTEKTCKVRGYTYRYESPLHDRLNGKSLQTRETMQLLVKLQLASAQLATCKAYVDNKSALPHATDMA